MYGFFDLAVYCVGLYCFRKTHENLHKSNSERDALKRENDTLILKLYNAAVREGKREAEKAEEEELKRIVRSRREKKEED